MKELEIHNYSLIGVASKPFGHKGEVSIKTNGTLKKSISPKDFLFFKINDSLVPFYVENSIKKGDTYSLKLETINNISQAEKYNGIEIFLPKASVKKTTTTQEFAHLIGFQLHDTKLGVIGYINEVVVLNGQVLIQVHYNTKEVLVPLAEELIKSIDNTAKTITLFLPEGILDL